MSATPVTLQPRPVDPRPVDPSVDHEIQAIVASFQSTAAAE